MNGYTIVFGKPLEVPAFRVYAPDGTELPHVFDAQTIIEYSHLRKLVITVPLEAIVNGHN
jgi:hypothetical protein